MLETALVLGVAVLFNFLSIVMKLKKGHYIDAVVDFAMVLALMQIYGNSTMGGVIATIGSAFISIFLMINPLTKSKVSMAKRLDKSIDKALSKLESTTRHW